MAIGFPSKTVYYPYPMCSVIKFELNPANQSKFYCAGKLTVLTRYTVSQDYTLQNGPGKVFHNFTNSCLPNHADCLFNRENSLLNGNRTDPITIYENCNLPYCTCQANQAPPQTNPLQTQYLPKVWVGDKSKTKEVPNVGMGDKPKINEVLNVGMGNKPKTDKVPKVGAGEAPMVHMLESPQSKI